MHKSDGVITTLYGVYAALIRDAAVQNLRAEGDQATSTAEARGEAELDTRPPC